MSDTACAKRWAGPRTARAALLALALAGCGPLTRTYTVQPLAPVVQPPEPSWGVDVDIDFTDRILVVLMNHSAEPVQVLWDECAYIDVVNASHRVIASGAPEGGATGRQLPSLIAPGTRLEAALLPVGHGREDGHDPFLPPRGKTLLLSPGYVGHPLFATGSEALIGKEIGVFLVLERGGARKSVLRRYRILNARLDA